MQNSQSPIKAKEMGGDQQTLHHIVGSRYGNEIRLYQLAASPLAGSFLKHAALERLTPSHL